MDRLQKLLAQRGLGSRREIETWITEGKVTVNGRVAKLGDRAAVEDLIRVNDRPVRFTMEAKVPRVLLYHKPEGEVCSRHDPEGRPTVFAALPPIKEERWISVGRLDFNTAGLLLFTNDGELANRLMHPSFELEREYAVRVYGEVSPEVLRTLKTGVKLEDGMARFLTIKDAGGEGKNHWYHVTLAEGRNREVRRLWESQEVVVSRLIRIRYGSTVLPPRLRKGKVEELTLDEVNALRRSVDLADYQVEQAPTAAVIKRYRTKDAVATQPQKAPAIVRQRKSTRFVSHEAIEAMKQADPRRVKLPLRKK